MTVALILAKTTAATMYPMCLAGARQGSGPGSIALAGCYLKRSASATASVAASATDRAIASVTASVAATWIPARGS